MGGKRKAQEGKKKTVFAFSVPTTAVFLSRTIGLSLERLREVKKRKKEKKKETRFLKFNIHKKAKVVTKISNCRVNTTSRGGNQTARDFFCFYFSSIFP